MYLYKINQLVIIVDKKRGHIKIEKKPNVIMNVDV
jgi:hypothetical protein